MLITYILNTCVIILLVNCLDKVEDINLDLEDFMQKVNYDLVGKVVNIASRSARFLVKKYDGMLTKPLRSAKFIRRDITKTGDEIAAAYENREFARAMRLIMQCADRKPMNISMRKNHGHLLRLKAQSKKFKMFARSRLISSVN